MPLSRDDIIEYVYGMDLLYRQYPRYFYQTLISSFKMYVTADDLRAWSKINCRWPGTLTDYTLGSSDYAYHYLDYILLQCHIGVYSAAKIGACKCQIVIVQQNFSVRNNWFEGEAIHHVLKRYRIYSQMKITVIANQWSQIIFDFDWSVSTSPCSITGKSR
jgi:hypothetical protein